MSPDYQYVWFAWASAFLVPWTILYWRFPLYRKPLLWASLLTMPFGLTEPLFVPEYWNPPSLFDLAQTSGFDIESLIFTFGIGGVGSALYNVVTASRLAPMGPAERHSKRHRYHRAVLTLPFLVFPVLYFLPWNPIYPGIAAMATGAAAAVACRPDLKIATLLGGLLFLLYYLVFMLGLQWTAPGYIEAVWNLDALSGLNLFGIPVEEPLFGFTFGMYWAGAYEHLTWTRSVPAEGQEASGHERDGKLSHDGGAP